MLKRLGARRSVTLGLDIRPEELRYACLERKNNGFALIHQGRIEAQPTDEGLLSMAEVVQRSLERRRIRPGRIVLGLPRQWCFIKTLTLPTMAEEDVGRALTFELEKHLPVEPDTLIYDHIILREQPGGDMTVLVGAVRRELIESLLSAWRAKDMEPEAVTPAPFANEALLKVCRPGVSQSGRVLLVEENDQTVGVDLFERGQLTSCQVFSLEGRSEPDATAGFERELFRGLSSTLGRTVRPEDLHWFLLGPSDGVATRALQALELGAPKPIGQRAAIQASEEVDIDRFHTAVGLALYGHKYEEVPINLLPPPSVETPRSRRLPRRAVLLGAALVMVLGLYGTVTLRAQWELRRLKNSVDALRPQVEEVHRIQRELSQQKAQVEAAEAMATRSSSALQILRELTLVIPASAWLTETSFNGRELLIGGYAESAQELIGLLEESALFANIEFRGTITKRKGKERFKIVAQIE